MILFDESARTIRLSVNDLVHAGELLEEEAHALNLPRAQMGGEVHAHYLAAQAAPGYRKEVPVCWTGPWRGYGVTVEGRADGCRQAGDGVQIEEIKSTLRHGALLDELHLNPRHAEQCGFYCLFLLWSGLPVVGGVVRYIPVSGGAGRDFDIGFQEERLAALLEQRLARRLEEIQETRRLARVRAAYAERLAFPFDGVRAGQQIMLDDVDGAMRDGHILLCSAPTGIGKTAAALFPALRQALRANRTLFFLTAKISQQELALATLRKMIRPNSEICAMQLTARERTCPMEEMSCMVGHCPLMEGFEARLPVSGVIPRCIRKGVVDGGALRELALAADLCPFETALALAQHATVVVADYNYVFDPSIALKRFFDAPEKRFLAVVDEAHNLPARAIGYYSPELDIGAMAAMAATGVTLDLDVYREAGVLLGSVCDHFRRQWATLAGEQEGGDLCVAEPDRQFFGRVLAELEPLLYQYFLFLANGGKRPPAFLPLREDGSKRLVDPLLTALFDLRNFSRCCALDPELFAVLWYRTERLKMLCLDPAPLLRDQIVQGFHGALFMSATLTPLDFYAKMLGVDNPATLTLELPSPFPKANRRFLVVNTVDTSFKRRSGEAASIARLLADTVALRKGNYLAFFPSFAYRDEVVGHLLRPPFRLILQEPGMRTEGIIRELTANTADSILLCGVMGGVFSEGVDYPGHLAIGAFIIGPGLPQVSAEQELVKSYFEAHNGAGFEFAYVNPGINRVVQAGGRVIRSESDRGFVMLICRRFTSKLYRRKFPQYWQEEIVVTGDPVDEIRRFWQGGEAVP